MYTSKQKHAQAWHGACLLPQAQREQCLPLAAHRGCVGCTHRVMSDVEHTPHCTTGASAVPRPCRPISSLVGQDVLTVAMNAGIFLHCIIAYQVNVNVWSSLLLHVTVPK